MKKKKQYKKIIWFCVRIVLSIVWGSIVATEGIVIGLINGLSIFLITSKWAWRRMIGE